MGKRVRAVNVVRLSCARDLGPASKNRLRIADGWWLINEAPQRVPSMNPAGFTTDDALWLNVGSCNEHL
jgi:hypothetical protein